MKLCYSSSLQVRTTQYERNHALIDIIQRTGPASFSCFMDGLLKTNQHHFFYELVKERIEIISSNNSIGDTLGTHRGGPSNHVGLSSIQNALRESYLKRFRSITPLSQKFTFNIEEKWVDLTLKLNDDSASTTENHIDLLQKVFNDVDMLIIEGDPATGKTSLLRRIAYEWSQNKSHLGDYNLILYAEFRSLREQQFKTIRDLLVYNLISYFEDEDYNRIKCFISDNKCYKEHKMLVLLDGYDESSLEDQCQELQDYLCLTTINRPLPFKVVLTSRRGYLSDLRGQRGRFIFTDILGFTTKLQKQRYIKKYFTAEKDAQSSNIIDFLHNVIEKNENLKKLSETPLLLTFICLLREYDEVKDGTEVDLFMNIIWCLLDWHQKDDCNRDVPGDFGYLHNQEKPTTKDRIIRDNYKDFPQLHLLGKLAMNDIFLNSFTEKDLKAFHIKEIVEQVGLLRKEEKRESLRTIIEYSFPHRTIQEFLMAFAFFFSNEEPSDDFCWLTFDIGKIIGSGITQRKLQNFLNQINSSRFEISESRKLLFSKWMKISKQTDDIIDANLSQSPIADLQSHNSSVEMLYQQGTQIFQSKEKAMELLKKQAEEGLACAQYNLGLLYRVGRVIDQTDEAAACWFKRAAEQGHVKAQNYLGYMHTHGQGVLQSDDEALKWYTKAAEKGLASAANNVGYIYQHGKGVRQSHEEAVRWYRKAADKGNITAKFNLGHMYEKGKGVLQSHEDAVKWYTEATEQGCADAAKILGFKYMHGLGVTQSYDKAIEWFKKAAEQGNDIAENELGCIYIKGKGVTQSDEEAVKWYKKAAEKGNAEAQKKLKWIESKGKGFNGLWNRLKAMSSQ